MSTTIDTSDAKIVLLGGAVALPLSSVSVTGPASGSIRYNSTTDCIEMYSPTGGGAWYPIGASIAYNTKTTLTVDTTLTQADIGSLIICNKSSNLNVTLPAISTLRAHTGMTIVASQSTVTIHAGGSDTIGGGSSFLIPKGSHLTIVNDGTSIWYGESDYNPVATVTPYVFESVSATVSAAGTTQTDAYQLPSKYNIVTTVAAGAGVKLPAFGNIGVGVEYVVINSGANTLLIYPQSGAQIDSLSTNAAYALAPGGKIRFVLVTANQWLSYNIITLSGAVSGTGTTNITTSFSSIASNTVLANATGGSAAPVATGVSALIDSALGNTEGAILYRGASVWADLVPGTSGQFLQTLGTGATPQWANCVTSVSAGTGLTGGPITTTGSLSLAPISNSTVLANVSGISAAPTATTVSTLLDDTVTNTQGAILYRNATGWTYLAPATSGEVLQTGGASANPSWATVSALIDGAVGNTQGDILYRGASAWSVLAPGTSGQLLKTGGTSANPSWSDLSAVIDSVIGNAQGDILYRDASAWMVLAPGTSGQVLQTGGTSANPSWANVVASFNTRTGAVTLSSSDVTTALGFTPIGAAIAANEVIANATGSSAVPVATTLTSLIDGALGNTQGDVLYRDASAWMVLAPGTSGQVLQTGGASANPSWANAVASFNTRTGAVTLSSSDVTTALTYTPVAVNSRFTEYAFYGVNTGASAGRLTTDGNSATTTNVGALADSSAAIFDIELLAYDVTTGAAVIYTLTGGLATRGVGAATMAIAGSPTFAAGTTTAGAPSISTIPTVAADTTNGGFNVEFTPPTANTDTWHITARMKVTLAS